MEITTVKKYLDLKGLYLYDKNIKNYIENLKDVRVYKSLLEFPAVGKSDTIYLALDTRNLYNWNSGYVRIGLDEDTLNKINIAYEQAQIAYDHANIKDGSNPHKTTYKNIVDIPNLATDMDINNLINS